MKRAFVTIATILSLPVYAVAQVPYETVPEWLSSESGYFGTGAAIDDIDGDSFPDLAISNGNDMDTTPNLAYLNLAGHLPNSAGWISGNRDYSGHCEFGDYDSDGFPELAVANFISDQDWNPARLQIYENIGGALESEPSWESETLFHSFRCTWGDADGDGDLDLAVATGEAYFDNFEPNLIFYNSNGLIESSPGWSSADSDASYDVKWVDIDLDSDLDLAFSVSGGPLKVYYNFGDSIAAEPGWMSDDYDNNNSMDFADVDGDGYPELAVAANTQDGGSGRFKLYRNIGGTLEQTPSWQSITAGYGSEAAFSDIDADGDFDIVGGRWWGLIYVYLNDQGEFGGYPDWNSSGSYISVVENIVFGDFNRGGEREYRTVFLDPINRLFELPYRQLASVDSVRIDGILAPSAVFCYSSWDGWISVGEEASNSVEVFYRHSPVKDMAVSNWDRETYVFFNTLPGFLPGDVNDSGQVDGLDIVFLVNYLKGGPAPELLLAADVDGDCQVDFNDVSYFLEYFRGGPAPTSGDCD